MIVLGQLHRSARDFVEAEVRRLFAAGFSLIPLGAGKDGKAPLTSFANAYTLSADQLLDLMWRNSSLTYGVRLNGLAVLDLDADDDALRDHIVARFGRANVQVGTSRGRHLYYRAAAGTLPNLRKEGFEVDVKSGANSYVVGPGSVRPSGARYEYLTDCRLGEVELTELATSAVPVGAIVGGRIPVGRRNGHLWRAALQLVAHVESPSALMTMLLIERDAHCEDPRSVPDFEVRGIAEWAWTLRLENSIFLVRNSAFRVDRSALDLLRKARNASDATALYVTLVDLHGHQPGKSFSLVHEAMRKAGLTDLSRERFIAARRTLERQGLLKKATGPVRGFAHAQYRLWRPVAGTIARVP